MRRYISKHIAVGGNYQGHAAEIVAIVIRDGDAADICPWCERPMLVPKRGDPPRPRDRTVEHIVPKTQGGTSHLDNLVLVCWECNQKRS